MYTNRRIQYQQTFANSCGAVALMCAADELGIKSFTRSAMFAAVAKSELPAQQNLGEITRNLISGSANNSIGVFTSPNVERAIYSLTSPDLESYSMPSRIVRMAKLLGLNCCLYIDNGFTSNFLEWKYKDTAKCQEATEIKYQQMGSLCENERALIVLVIRFGVMGIPLIPLGVHYVMQRPGNCEPYMDPSSGKHYHDLSHFLGPFGNFHFAGISIKLWKYYP